jgi:YVTN family beta-propeller protein
MSATSTTSYRLAFAMLGPLQVTRAGNPVALGGRQQRAILGRLLVAGASGATFEQIADMLWGERPPNGYATTIQTYVFHLRKALEPERGRGAPGQVLVTVNGRYRLSVPDEAIDVRLFEGAAEAGRRLLAAGEFDAAADELRRGLALWRGDVLADLAEFDFVAIVAARLGEQRLAATEAEIDCKLGLGRHAAVIGELDELVAQNPLREELQAKRMLALYRSGRQSDALSSYDRLRRELRDELGVDPSAPLQQLYQTMLTHDTALDWHPPPGADEPPPVATKAGTAAAPRRRRAARRRWMLAGCALVVAGVVAGVSAVVVSHARRSSLPALPANSIGVLSRDGSLHDAVEVGQSPEGVAYGAGALWVANAADDTVSRVDPSSHAVVQTIPVGGSPVAVAVSGQDVWVANSGDATVTLINAPANRVVQTAKVGSLPAAIVAGDSGVWVANSGDDTVQRIDPRSVKAGAAIPVGEGPDGLALDGSSLWVANGRDGTLDHLDATTGDPLSGSIHVGSGAKEIAMIAGEPWVAAQSALSITRVEPHTGRTVATIPVGDGPHSLVAAFGSVWVSGEYDGTISEINPVTNRVTHRYATGSSPRGLVLAGSNLWVSSAAFTDASHVGGTLVVEAADGSMPYVIDPSLVYNDVSIAGVRPVYDGLVALRGVSGAAGVGLVPDLAMDLPTPTDGGRTYTFTIRQGIHYSNGRLVHASDIERGLLRALTISGLDPGAGTANPGFFAAVIGAQHCIDAATSCDLSKGVQTDDRTGRITFRLIEPDAEFLYKLASFAVATAPGAPRTLAKTPLPGTGPYMISSYQEGDRFELTRNPYFKQWSFAAQPAGYPDVIRWHHGSSSQAAANDVIAGRGDLVNFLDLGPAQANYLTTHYRDQVHASVSFGTQWIALNTRVAPFSDQRARQALSYAIDRRTLASLAGGPYVARPTCQLLPPGFPAYETYCPYATDDLAPKLDVARKLVAQSPTRGMAVTVYGRADLHARNAYLAQVLRQLGYRATFVDLPDPAYVFLSDSRNRVQISSGFGWAADYPSPSTFYTPLVSCSAFVAASTSNVNRSEYCNPALDEEARRAESHEVTDTTQSRKDWINVYRRLLDDAPVIPFANGITTNLVSARVGNYQSSPLGRVDLDQIWVH